MTLQAVSLIALASSRAVPAIYTKKKKEKKLENQQI
jgi:hypothetical protein